MLLPLQVQPPQPPWMAAFQQQQQQQQQQLAPPQAQMPPPADAMGASMPAWWQQLAQQGQQAQPHMQQVTRQSDPHAIARCHRWLCLSCWPCKCQCTKLGSSRLNLVHKAYGLVVIWELLEVLRYSAVCNAESCAQLGRPWLPLTLRRPGS